MTPRPTDSTEEFENLSDEVEELCYSSFSRIYVTPIWSFSLFLDLTNLCFLFALAQMSAEQKGLGDRAMGDGVHATVSVKQPMMIQDQSSQTTYHPKNGEKACLCCHFYGVPCRQVRATNDEATTRRNQRLFSVQRERGLIKSSW